MKENLQNKNIHSKFVHLKKNHNHFIINNLQSLLPALLFIYDKTNKYIQNA